MNDTRISRRKWIERASQAAAGFPLNLSRSSRELLTSFLLSADQRPQLAWLQPETSSQQQPSQKVHLATYRFSEGDEALLNEAERASFLYFWEATNPYTGLVKDRSQANGPDARTIASIAATGFGLTALCIGHHRDWAEPKTIRDRVRNTLRFALTRLAHMNGFFFHFLDVNTGDRAFESEISTIDTSILLCGALACRAYFEDTEIADLATKLYERADWTWFLQGGKTLSMGWKPEQGAFKTRWDTYSELMMMYLLGLGSSTHALSPDSWDAWKRPQYEYYGIQYIGAPAPLFVHQYSHAWFDFRGKRDAYTNYFLNSALATKAHKLWCLNLTKQFPDYSEDLWGISASDSQNGYQAWGGPPPMGKIDGSIVPCAAGGSLPFLPAETIRVLRTIREKYGKQAWRRYGFVDAFNPLRNWYNPDVLGIDAGITLLMAENARTGFVWEHFMEDENVKKGMVRAGFHSE